MWPDLGPLWLSFRLAAVTTAVLLLIGVPLAGWMAHRRSALCSLLDTLVAMPLVLPPSVLGFYLLLLLSPAHRPARWLADYFGWQLIFSFPALVVGSVIYSLPFMVQPLLAALRATPASLREAAYTLGRSPLNTFFAVELPSAARALVTGMIMSFAHTLGEFGLVLMIGGNIPGQTQVASIAIYQQVEQLDYPAAHWYAAILCSFSFVVLLAINLLQRRASWQAPRP